VVEGSDLLSGTYVVAASSTVTINSAWRAFDGTTDNRWQSAWSRYSEGDYIGTASSVADGITYRGEWLQLDLPGKVVLTAWETFHQSTDDALVVKEFALLGSADASTWHLIHTGSLLREATGFEYVQVESQQYAYDHYRLVALGNFGGGGVTVRSLKYHAQTNDII
jgi:hypothetical protein